MPFFLQMVTKNGLSYLPDKVMEKIASVPQLTSSIIFIFVPKNKTHD